MQLLYNLGIYFYGLTVWLAAFFHPKAKQWITGRKNIWEVLANNIPDNRSVIWVHCASLGEFEQGRPIIEAIKKKYPTPYIILTFFSPSGYEIRKHYPQADCVSYLPLDTPANAKRFVKIIQPKLVVFVKYEFWYNYLKVIQEEQIQAILISAVFHRKQPFFGKWYSPFFQEILHCFNHIFVQASSSAHLLQQINVLHHTVVGDTRIDRVVDMANTASTFPIVEKFVGDAPILVCGSTWQADEAIICSFINQNISNWKFIIAPHDVSNDHIEQIKKHLRVPYFCYSEAGSIQDFTLQKVLIIDSIGMLAQLYQYGKVAYIGGGFSKGIHNTLEPAAFNLPILIGMNYEKFEEARQLVQAGGMFVINNLEMLAQQIKKLEDAKYYTDAANKVQQFITDNQGATEKIMNYLEKHKYLE
jgi:3-deoxy-D-manno-octulosonic-acid transferase